MEYHGSADGEFWGVPTGGWGGGVENSFSWIGILLCFSLSFFCDAGDGDVGRWGILGDEGVVLGELDL
jgi:hypothetical protein